MRIKLIVVFLIALFLIPVSFLVVRNYSNFNFPSFPKPPDKMIDASPSSTTQILTCPLPKGYCHSYTTEKSKLDSGTFFIFPSTIPKGTPVYAVWDGELQPGRAGLPGALASSIRVKNSQGLEANYLFDGIIDGSQTLPRNVRKGSKIGETGKSLPPLNNQKNTVLIFSIQKLNTLSSSSSAKMTSPIVLNEQNIKFEQ